MMLRTRQPIRIGLGLGLVTVVCCLGLWAVKSTAQEGNVEDGAEVFKARCRACHDVGPHAKNKVGPVLNGIVGRKAGSVESFNYSQANRKAGENGLVWTESVMFKYLEAPLRFMPGTKMAFAGLSDARDRKDVIAYLKTFAAKAK